MHANEGKYSKKRIRASFAAVVALVAMALLIQLTLIMLPHVNFKLEPIGVASAAENPTEGEGAVPAEEDGALLPVLDETADGAEALSRLRVDGSFLNRDEIRQVVVAGGGAPTEVEAIDQGTVLASGCEVLALCASLESLGYEIDPIEFAHKYLKYGSGDDIEEYLGSPETNGGCFPPSIVAAANKWLMANDSDLVAFDATGSSLDDLLAVCDLGYPVLIWTTEGFVDPEITQSFAGSYRWYTPEHCVVLYGEGDDGLLIADSLDLKAAPPDRDRFAEVYRKCGSMAVVLLPLGDF